MSPRKYDATQRRASVDATRTQILEAAREIVGAGGDLRRFSMEAIARKAGVARMTVYYQFRSRAGLLDALADHLAQRGGMQRMQEVFQTADPEEALRKFVDTFVRFWATDRIVMRRLRALGVVSPALYGRPRNRDEWRHEAASQLLTRFGSKGRSSGRPSAQDRVDLLSELTSFETFDALAVEGRSTEEVSRLLGDVALTLLSPKSSV
jgi:AcrR family transcriptional regulator